LIELMRDSLENEIPHIHFKDVSFSYPGKKESLISVIPSFSEVNSDELHISPNIELSKYN